MTELPAPRELPLAPMHRQAGAAMRAWQRWMVPVRFSDSAAEYWAVRRAAGLIDWSVTEAIDVAGADRIGFLHSLLSQDIRSLRPGAGAASALLAPNGKLLAELLVLAEQDRHLLLCLGTRVPAVLETLERYRIAEDVRLAMAGDQACLALQGPASQAILTEALAAGLGPDPGAHASCRWNGAPLRIIRHTITGEPGFLLLAPAAEAAALWTRLAGPACPVGWDALEILRLEALIPWFGIDMDDTSLLPETGLETSAASDRKGCYVGQEVIARLATYGSVSRKLCGWQAGGPEIPRGGDAIMKGAELIGTVTSGGLSIRLGRAIGLGWIKRPHYAQPGPVDILRDGTRLPAQLISRPTRE